MRIEDSIQEGVGCSAQVRKRMGQGISKKVGRRHHELLLKLYGYTLVITFPTIGCPTPILALVEGGKLQTQHPGWSVKTERG